MARTVVYEAPEVLDHYRDLAPRELGGKTGRARASSARKAKQQAEAQASAGERAPAGASGAPQDDYVSKIAKYVPAETIAIATLGFGVFDPKGNWVWFWLALGAAANVVYLLAVALKGASKVPLPRTYFYGLSAVAFGAWAVATVPAARAAAHLTDDQRAGFVLAAAAFLIPALDTIFSAVELRRRPAPAAAAG